jgi:hypothetical protein
MDVSERIAELSDRQLLELHAKLEGRLREAALREYVNSQKKAV